MPFIQRDTTDDDQKRHIEEELDEALEETFPASDPVEPPLPSEHRPPATAIGLRKHFEQTPCLLAILPELGGRSGCVPPDVKHRP